MAEDIKEETTNKVLETKIDSLKELTDTKFKNIESTLTRIEQSNLVTIATFNEREKLQDAKIESLILDRADMKGKISTLRIGGGILIVIIGIAEFIVGHYWR